MHQKAILSPHSLTPSRKPLELFIFWIFMLCVVFFFLIFYIEPTIFLREMCMANGQEWGVCMAPSPHRNCLIVCLSQGNEQTKKEARIKATHLTATACTRLTLLRSKWGRSLAFTLTHTCTHTSPSSSHSSYNSTSA